MNAQDAPPADDHTKETTPGVPASPAPPENMGSRAADLSADRYASLEHECRKARFDKLATRTARS